MTPDRRPIKRVSLYTGNANHPRGLRDQIATLDGYRDYLFSQLDTRYALGWRRFMLHAPAGRPPSTAGTGFGLYHHQHLPEDVRAMLKRDLAEWLAVHLDAVVSVYVGFAVVDGGRYHVTKNDPDWRQPNPQDPRDRDAFLLEVEQWLAISPEPGQIGVGLDASRLRPDYLVGWAQELRARGVWVMGEAIPEVATNDAFAPEADLAPWWASYSFLIAPNRPHRLAKTWDPATTEVIVGFQNGNVDSTAKAKEWHDRGYVLSSWGDTQDAFVLEASV